MRTIEVSGRIAANAEKKISKNGREYLYFRIGNNEFNDKDDNGQQKTYWITVTSFNQRHFGMLQYLTKGKPIIVNGEYSDRIYTNKTTGAPEIGREIVANAIYFNPFGGENNGDGTQTKPTATAQIAQTAPTAQTVMHEKPSTADLKIPTQAPASDDKDDDLPF